MNTLTFIPVGGLANRMRAMASAVTLAEASRCALEFVWFQDWALHAPFCSIFETPEGLRLREATLADTLTLDRPRRRNLGLPRLWQRLRFDACLYEQAVTPLQQGGFDFRRWAEEGGRRYMASYSAFFPYDEALLGALFVPVAEVRREIELRQERFAPETVGVHIRRTDHAASIAKSPTGLFFEALDRDLERNPALGIFLATDSEEVKQEMRRRYGNRVLTAEAGADRSSAAGIRDGVADMFTLARTQRIYGSFQSSFSEMASQIGGVPLRVLARD